MKKMKNNMKREYSVPRIETKSTRIRTTLLAGSIPTVGPAVPGTPGVNDNKDADTSAGQLVRQRGSLD